MEISGNTINILKNFAAVNSNFVIKPGNSIMTISEAKNVLAEATIPEEFDKEIGIYDLQEFLNVLSLVEQPRVRFEDNYMNISGISGRETIKYYYADTDMLTTPTKPITMPDIDVSFTLDQSTLSNIKRAASVLGHGQLIIEPDNGSVKLSVVDLENTTANIYSISVDGEYKTNNSFKFVINIANLKMIADDYQVDISSKLISQFTNTSDSLKYWVALEKTSIYGE